MYHRRKHLQDIISRTIKGEEPTIDIKLYGSFNPSAQEKIIAEYLANSLIEEKRNYYHTENLTTLSTPDMYVQRATGTLREESALQTDKLDNKSSLNKHE